MAARAGAAPRGLWRLVERCVDWWADATVFRTTRRALGGRLRLVMCQAHGWPRDPSLRSFATVVLGAAAYVDVLAIPQAGALPFVSRDGCTFTATQVDGASHAPLVWAVQPDATLGGPACVAPLVGASGDLVSAAPGDAARVSGAVGMLSLGGFGLGHACTVGGEGVGGPPLFLLPPEPVAVAAAGAPCRTKLVVQQVAPHSFAVLGEAGSVAQLGGLGWLVLEQLEALYLSSTRLTSLLLQIWLRWDVGDGLRAVAVVDSELAYYIARREVRSLDPRRIVASAAVRGCLRTAFDEVWTSLALPAAARITSFLVDFEPFTSRNGLATPTLVLCRSALEAKYKARLGALAADDASLPPLADDY